MKDFITQAKGLTKNPLGIIALFISLIYWFACLVLGFSSNNLVTDERILLIYFLTGFPILILITFIFLAVKHHKKLYAPSDYKDEKKKKLKGSENEHSQMTLTKEKEAENKTVNLKTNDDDDVNKSMTSLLKWSSGKGLFALCAIDLAKKNNKKFTLEDLESNSPFLS